MKRIILALFSCLFLCTIAYDNHFVIIIPSYNNINFYQKNLDSVFIQNYQNYRIIYIDDCSPDNTGTKVQEYIKLCNQEHRCTLIKNKRRLKHMANHFRAAHMCNEQEIIVHLDGDDWFANENVLQTLNQIYQDPAVWLTYGQFIHYPAMTLGGCKPYPQEYLDRRDFRYYEHIAGHPRTFRAGLFKHIRLKDLLYNGEFVPCCADIAMMVPMLELSGGTHIRCLSEVLTYYNMNNPLNIFKTPGYYTSLLHTIESSLRSHERKKYPLLDYYHAPVYPTSSTTILIFCHGTNNSNTQLLEILKKIKRNGSGYSSVYIFYQSTPSNTLETSIKALNLPQCSIINTANSLDKSLKEIVKNSSENYIFILNTDYAKNLSFNLNFNTHIQQLHKTFAIGYFEAITAYTFIKNKTTYLDLSEGYMGWQIAYGASLPYNFTINGALYTKQFIKKLITNKKIMSIQDLAQAIESNLPYAEIAIGRNY